MPSSFLCLALFTSYGFCSFFLTRHTCDLFCVMTFMHLGQIGLLCYLHSQLQDRSDSRDSASTGLELDSK